MNIDELIIYCQCYGENIPRYNQFKQIPLMCNAHSLTESRREELTSIGFKFDDEGQNISNLNWTFGDLTGTYYIWKNTEHEFVGQNQYRRFWDENAVRTLEKNTLYYPAPWPFHVSTAEQYIQCVGETGLNFLKMVTQNTPKQIAYDALHTMTHINACNMFFGHKDAYDKFCEVLFEIMFDVYKVSEDYLRTKMDEYERRTIAFVAERVMTSLIHHHDYFFNEIKMVPVPIYTI